MDTQGPTTTCCMRTHPIPTMRACVATLSSSLLLPQNPPSPRTVPPPQITAIQADKAWGAAAVATTTEPCDAGGRRDRRSHSRHIGSVMCRTMLFACTQSLSAVDKVVKDEVQLLLASTNFLLHTNIS